MQLFNLYVASIIPKWINLWRSLLAEVKIAKGGEFLEDGAEGLNAWGDESGKAGFIGLNC